MKIQALSFDFLFQKLLNTTFAFSGFEKMISEPISGVPLSENHPAAFAPLNGKFPNCLRWICHVVRHRNPRWLDTALCKPNQA